MDATTLSSVAVDDIPVMKISLEQCYQLKFLQCKRLSHSSIVKPKNKYKNKLTLCTESRAALLTSCTTPRNPGRAGPDSSSRIEAGNPGDKERDCAMPSALI
jgi:hypothetical protein